MARKIVKSSQKPARKVLPATLANLRHLSNEDREMLFRCLKVNYEQGGDGTVAIDYRKDAVYIPDARTVSGDNVEVFRLKPDLVKEFAEAIGDLGAAEPVKKKAKAPPKR